MQRYFSIIYKTVILVCFILNFEFCTLNLSFAANPNFTLSPSTGFVITNADFTTDIKIDSAGKSLTLARAVLIFDPAKLKITKVEKNNAIFCQWPADQQTTDNTNGVVMLTGFCQSGASNLYKTVGNPDVFARITFKPLKDGEIKLEWEFTGNDEPFKSAILENGSPPLNVLTSRPTSALFTAAAATATTNTNSGTTTGTTPVTGIDDMRSVLIGLGIILGSIMVFAGSSVYVAYNRGVNRKKYKTVLILDN